jgi:hypothetical protein
MKTFKQFIKNPVTSSNDTTSNVKPQYAFNSHGSHAKAKPDIASKDQLKPQYAFNSHGSHAKSDITEDIEHKPISEFLNSNLNREHLNGETHDTKMDHLHELHPLTDSAKRHLRKYTNYSRDLNKGLLTAKENGTPVPKTIGQHDVEGLDSSFTPSKTTLHTYSGIGFNPANVVQAGKSAAGNPVFQSPTYISSTHNTRVARRFAVDAQSAGEPHAHILHIETKPGQKIAAIGSHSVFPAEQETLMPRDEHYEHVGTTKYYDKDDDLTYAVHHVRRIPKSEIIKT